MHAAKQARTSAREVVMYLQRQRRFARRHRSKGKPQ